MSQTAITLAFEQWKAQQAATDDPVLLDEFVFALVPGLEPDLPVERSETLPPDAQIVYRQAVSRRGVVNENAVVHSVVLGADVGDFSFNWIGLINKASGTLAMIVHAPEQQKLKTKEGQQGNVLTRSFLMEFNGAQAETAINTPAETWQIDFTARMAGMDERQRLENTDIYGVAAFSGDGWLVAKTGNQFYVTKGVGYVAGLRACLAADQNITVTKKPVNVWLDVCWTGALTSVWGVQSKITVAGSPEDYVKGGIKHYVCALASIDENGNITDLRPKGSLPERQANEALRQHEQSRNHPDASLTEKGFVRLSSSVTSASESVAATPRAVKAANDNANGRVRAGGGEGMTTPGNNQITLGWDNNSKLLAQVDSTPLGEVFTELSPPTPAQVGAVPASGGDVAWLNNAEYYSAAASTWPAAGSFAGQYTDPRAPFVKPFGYAAPRGTSNYLPVIKGLIQTAEVGWGTAVSFGTLTTGDAQFARACIHVIGDNGLSQAWLFDPHSGSFASPGQVNAGGAFIATDGNIYGSCWGGYLNNWIAGQLNARATYDYVNQNFVRDIRLASQGWLLTDGAMTEAPGGGVITGGNGNEGNQLGYMYFRYLQKNVNGNWYTVAYA